MKHSTMKKSAVLVAAALVAASCSSENSALDAGNDDTPGPTESAATEPDTTADPTTDTVGDADDGETGDTAPSVTETTEGSDTTVDSATTEPATTEPGPTTTVAPLADLPPCPVDALDAADGPVELTFWYGLGNELETALLDVVAEYNASQDRVVVDAQNQISYEAIVDKYIQSGESGRPDIVQLPEYTVQSFAQSDTFVPVEACSDASGFDLGEILPRALSAYVFEGVQWALPFNVSNPVLYYNRTMFAEAGLTDDDSPVSLEELRSVSQQLVDSGAAATGIALDSSRDSGGAWFLEQWFGRAGQPYADNDNGRTAPATKVLFNSEFGVELFTYLQDLVADGLAVTVGDNAGGQDAFLKMIDETAPAAMTMGTSAALSSVLALLSGGIAPGFVADDLGVGPMPGPGDEPAAQVGGASLWIPAGKSDEATAAAWDFITYMVDAQTQSTWAARTGYVPVRADALELDPIRTTYAEDPRFRVAYDQLLAADDGSTSALPALGPHREVRAETADAIASVYAGADVAATLAEAEAAANALIENYNARN